MPATWPAHATSHHLCHPHTVFEIASTWLCLRKCMGTAPKLIRLPSTLRDHIEVTSEQSRDRIEVAHVAWSNRIGSALAIDFDFPHHHSHEGLRADPPNLSIRILKKASNCPLFPPPTPSPPTSDRILGYCRPHISCTRGSILAWSPKISPLPRKRGGCSGSRNCTEYLSGELLLLLLAYAYWIWTAEQA